MQPTADQEGFGEIQVGLQPTLADWAKFEFGVALLEDKRPARRAQEADESVEECQR